MSQAFRVTMLVLALIAGGVIACFVVNSSFLAVNTKSIIPACSTIPGAIDCGFSPGDSGSATHDIGFPFVYGHQVTPPEFSRQSIARTALVTNPKNYQLNYLLFVVGAFGVYGLTKLALKRTLNANPGH